VSEASSFSSISLLTISSSETSVVSRLQRGVAAAGAALVAGAAETARSRRGCSSAWSFHESASAQSSVGRDTGFRAKGYLAGDHLEYRVGVTARRRCASTGA